MTTTGKPPGPQVLKTVVLDPKASALQIYGRSHSPVVKSASPSKSLSLDLDNVALAYFLSYHIVVGSGILDRGQYEFLPELLASQQHVDPALHHSLNAAGFAAFANSHGIVSMLHKSRVECNSAIRALHTALQSPETAAKDSTLVAAMLLSTFETVTYVYHQDVESCLDQITGGLALLKIRGPRSLNTRPGRQMFLQAYSLVVAACMQREHAVPPTLFDLRNNIKPSLDQDSCSWQILDLMVQFTNLSASLKNNSHQETDRSSYVLSAATQLDNEFQAIASELRSTFRYEIFRYSHSSLVYNGIYHVYDDAWTIRYWNYLRLCRILLQKMVLDNCHPSLDPTPARYQSISTTIIQLSIDVCATVAQHAGYLPLLQHQQLLSRELLNQNASQPEAGPYTAGIYSLLHPLFVIGKMKITPMEQKEWIISQLEYLGRLSGISQAMAAMEVMKL
ncbi:uncharacterized protein LY89DRAFT_777846 [Mollisia scopiformis]|uniref:Uncharacterized protein n=1 Tax=Mollisia scopiformis TaxID=149040 RepID=A0A194XSW1_MOLSC|nr:uncharacterized protein LY89DRAFT_777846 [Mollisia scopiformis]KUJ22817.1 hypothetical protein LY89DRAFT_777846 [Mollisia scopiformis]